MRTGDPKNYGISYQKHKAQRTIDNSKTEHLSTDVYSYAKRCNLINEIYHKFSSKLHAIEAKNGIQESIHVSNIFYDDIPF